MIQKDNIETKVCKIHGEYETYTQTILNGIVIKFDSCPKCDEEQALKIEEIKKERQKDQSHKSFQDYLEKSGVGKRYWSCKINSYNKREGVDISNIIRFCREPKDNILVILGKNGIGKTHLGSAICIHHRGIYYSMFGLMNDTLRSIDERTKIIEKCVKSKMLVIDEIGKQSGSVAEKNLFFHIIEERYRNELPTVLISNLDLKNFEEFVGLSITDRLQEVGVYQIMDCPSYRQRELIYN